MSLNIPLMHWKAQPPVKDSSENEEEFEESGRDVKENKVDEKNKNKRKQMEERKD